VTCSCPSDSCLHGDDVEGCRSCDGEGHRFLNGGCYECDPSCSLEYSPIRASFVVVDGVVSERSL